MIKLTDISENDFVNFVLLDEKDLFAKHNVKITKVELPDLKFNELEYYIHNVGFCLGQCLMWCKQLDTSSEILSNFDYSKSGGITRR